MYKLRLDNKEYVVKDIPEMLAFIEDKEYTNLFCQRVEDKPKEKVYARYDKNISRNDEVQ